MTAETACGERLAANLIRRELLADWTPRAGAGRRPHLRLVRRAPAGQIAGPDVLREVELACERVRARVRRIGPGLAQSGLLALLDLRLPETSAHARRVARVAVAVARTMGLAESDVRDIRSAALLHDIGKLAIPRRILRHRGRLGEGDLAVVRLHARLGADIVAEDPVLARLGPMIAATHERYDGSGYPDGLAGAAIPLGARIIAVADSFDAMVAPRPYCAPLPYDEARNELVRCSGALFDPDVVRGWVTTLARMRCAVPAVGEAGVAIPVQAS